MAVHSLLTGVRLTTQSKQFIHRVKMGICLFLACVGTSWFSYQLFLVAQPVYFAPHWQNAQWIQASDGGVNPVSYFRYSTDLNTVPDAAFVTIAANQSFRFYVNGTFIGTNEKDVANGNVARAYIYDVVSSLRPGPNVIAAYVANLDQQVPAVRINLGIKRGRFVSYYGSNPRWQATGQSTLAYPRNAISSPRWTGRGYDASSWLSAKQAVPSLITPMLSVNPSLYEQALPTSWMSAGAGHDAYFVRTISLPLSTAHTWLRIIATGPATVFINGQLFTVWNGQASVRQQHLSDSLGEGSFADKGTAPQYKRGLTLGIYDISSYLRVGTNTLAIHVTSPGSSAAQVGLQTLSAALSMDILVNDGQDKNAWIASDTAWRTSPQPVDGWTGGNVATQAWTPPFSVGRPGVSDTIYLPDSKTLRNTHILRFSSVLGVFLISSCVVLGLWLLISLFVLRRYFQLRSEALATFSLAYMPALGAEMLLILLASEPLLPRPFPYTWQWGLVLLVLVGLGYLLLWLHARMRYRSIMIYSGIVRAYQRTKMTIARFPLWFRRYWGLLLIMALAIPMIGYAISYEPYWQDELTSYYAAKGILAHGLPFLPSGFLYPKGELYSYMLALSIALLGEQNGMIRLPSIVMYLLSLPLFFMVVRFFFDRKVALLATAMLAFSPYALIWGRGVRMYELAQFMTILVMYIFCKAAQEYWRPRLAYIAMAALIIMYVSHEETFIFLPALVVGVLVVSRDAHYRLPSVLYQKHWWIATMLGAGIIGTQLLVVKLSHPPVLGLDQSQQPLIQLATDNLPYYVKLFFFPFAGGRQSPTITVNSLLAFVGCIWALHRGDARARYCALFFLISLLTLVLVFSPTADRYIYPLLPAFYMLGAFILMRALRTLWELAVPGGARQSLEKSQAGPMSRLLSSRSIELRDELAGNVVVTSSKPGSLQSLNVLTMLTTMLVCAGVLIAPALPISNYNLFTSRVLGVSYHHHYPDYDAAGQYIQQHWRSGDVVISVSPAISTLYYVDHLDYFFSMDRALYLFERGSSITDTPTGTTPLLNQGDFQAVLSRHPRIWLVTNKWLNQTVISKEKRFLFPPDFRLEYQGYSSVVYLRDG